MQLLNGVEANIQGGNYCIMVDAGTGTASLSFRTSEMGSALVIPDTSFNADTMKSLKLPKGLITATITGDALVYIEPHVTSTR